MSRTHRQRLKELLILTAVIGVIGAGVLVSGIVPIRASSGHWAITRWLLDFASDRSIGLHSSGVSIPEDVNDRSLILGAATYDTNCRWCHGAPGFPMPTPATQMTPSPPRLAEAIDRWDDGELFYLLKHGIKFAGMPAWAAKHRDDEIWPVVRFLRAQQDLSADRYQRWVAPPTTADSGMESLVAQRCGMCHGSKGQGRAGPAVPMLAGQSETYLASALMAYRHNQRHSGIMQPIAVRLTRQQILDLAKYFAEQEVDLSSPSDPPDGTNMGQGSVQAGERLAVRGDAAMKIAACQSCHGPKLDPGHSDYPRLAGQPARYLVGQLKLFADRHRGGSPDANLMHPIADKLSDQQMRDIAAYYQSLRWQGHDDLVSD